MTFYTIQRYTGKILPHILLCFITVFTNAQSRNDQVEIYFTRQILSRYQDASLYPHQTGGSIVKSRIIQVIRDAKLTIDVCVYNNSDADIVSALKVARSKGLRVRYITDDETANSALSGNLNFQVLYTAKGDGIMHNKFIVTDAASPEATVLVGSTNFTSNGFNDDANNILVIKNQEMAQAFQAEFEEMWGGQNATPGPNPKSGAAKSDNTQHQFEVAGIPIEVYFSPSDHTGSRILDAIRSVDYNLRFAMYTFTSDELADAVVAAKSSGASVRGITDNNEDNFGKLKFFQQKGLDVIDHSPSSLLHHKYAIIDAEYPDSEPIVITGSHNWTWSADNINDESTLLIHDPDIAKLYVAEFNSRYCELAPWDCNLIATERAAKGRLKVYPGLFVHGVHIESQEGDRIESISIYDLNGRPVFYKKLSPVSDLNIDLSFLPGGTYLLSAGLSGGRIAVEKITKF